MCVSLLFVIGVSYTPRDEEQREIFPRLLFFTMHVSNFETLIIIIFLTTFSSFLKKTALCNTPQLPIPFNFLLCFFFTLCIVAVDSFLTCLMMKCQDNTQQSKKKGPRKNTTFPGKHLHFLLKKRRLLWLINRRNEKMRASMSPMESDIELQQHSRQNRTRKVDGEGYKNQ